MKEEDLTPSVPERHVRYRGRAGGEGRGARAGTWGHPHVPLSGADRLSEHMASGAVPSHNWYPSLPWSTHLLSNYNC